MSYEDLLIMRGLEALSEGIDQIEIAILKGLATIAAFLVVMWFVLYFLGWQAFNGHWQRTLIILGIWLFFEFAYFVGGGHSSRSRSHI